MTVPAPRTAATEVRTSRKALWAGALGGQLVRAVCATLRVERHDRCGILTRGGMPAPVIIALWHNRIFVAPAQWHASCGRWRRMAVLTSASHDGAAVARAMAVFGFGSVRGSTSRRGAAALVALRRVLAGGSDVAITPDGPRGPRYVVQPGIIKLAQSSGAPIVPLHATCSAAWRLQTWDGFMIPRPFSRLTVTYDDALVVPRRLADDEPERWRLLLEQRLRAGVDDLAFQPRPRKTRQHDQRTDPD